MYGIRVGTSHDSIGLTGCTVVLCPDGAVVGVDVRGSSPATRETDLCRPGMLVDRAHAIFLTGGSAFGLDAAAGVMRFLREQGHGFVTPAGPIPIVPSAAIFDLTIGEAVWPNPEMAYAACSNSSTKVVEQGCVGAGIGATVGKLSGPHRATKSGVGTASVRAGVYTVAALMVVNAAGNVMSPTTGEIIAGTHDPDSDMSAAPDSLGPFRIDRSNTTIGVVATDAPLNKEQVNHLATVAHDGLARAIRPAHTLLDGDAIFCIATGNGSLLWMREAIALESAAAMVTERAIVNAVLHATPMGGLPSATGALPSGIHIEQP